MGNKIGSDWEVISITPEGKRDWIASSCNVSVAKAAYEEALKHRPGREVWFVHGALILRKEVGPEKGR
ncbi:hypothetical protein [Bosea sp. FBZP-16]|uniref:hypothetical protein n=1 Tax=Bosea sp. FBZP-16 TaxID=2065382 RepID=UPI000C318734|nr:hypothetical protein [Bosea sp. FBZP-16]